MSEYRESVEDMLFSSPHLFLITPNDSVDLESITRAISFAAEGALHIIDKYGEEVTIPSGYLAAKVGHAFRVRKVFATGTTATGILGWV